MTNAGLKTKQTVRTQEASHSASDTISRGTIGVLGAVSLLIGLFGIVSLFAGLVHAGGILEFVKSWFQAVGGF